MNGVLLAIQGAISQGILWSIMSLGIYITFRLLAISDLSVDGTFAVGGCVMATLVTLGVSPVLATLMGMLAGALGGLVTGLLHTKCQIPAILAGILTQLGVYSINLRLMGRSNLPLLKLDTIFKQLEALTSLKQNQISIIVGIVVTLLVIALMYWFFGTEIGSAIRATGSNENMVRSLGVNTDTTKILGLMLANGLVALSGALVSQSQGYADVKQGIGAIVIGLASIIIGETMIRKHTNFAVRLGMIVLGSIVYRLIISIVLQLGLNTDDLKLFSAILVALFLTVPHLLKSKKAGDAHVES